MIPRDIVKKEIERIEHEFDSLYLIEPVVKNCMQLYKGEPIPYEYVLKLCILELAKQKNRLQQELIEMKMKEEKSFGKK